MFLSISKKLGDLTFGITLVKFVYSYKNTRTTAQIFVKSAQQRVECHELDLNEIWTGGLSHAVS